MSQDIPQARTPRTRSRSSSINFRLPSAPEEAHPRQQSSTTSGYFDSADNLPNSISRTHSHDIDEIRSHRAPLSRNQSNVSSTSTTTRSTSRSRGWYRNPRNSIFTTASQLSRPPSYKQRDPLPNEQPDDANRDTSQLAGWPSIASQFQGIYFAFWLVLLSFLGAVSVFVPGLPQAAMVLWVPIVLYLAAAVFMFRRRRSKQVRNEPQEDTANPTDQAHESMRQMRLPDSYYFVINNTKDHTHPVVTLLPPPPNYRNGDKSTQRNSMEIEEVEPEAQGTAEQRQSQPRPQPQPQASSASASTSTNTAPVTDYIQINIEQASDDSGTPELANRAQFETEQRQPALHPQTATM